MNRPITIVGGGLAGLTLGIGLRANGVPVTLLEAGSYPRHRVCGEFISGHGQESLKRLGLLQLVEAIGAKPLLSAAFYNGTQSSPVLPLPQPALGISRHTLDARLAGEFQSLGGELLTSKRGFEPWAEGSVRTTGRRKTQTDGKYRLIGLKVHAHNVHLIADLEMHFLPNGYVGLCRLSSGVVNVCGLFRTSGPIANLAQEWPRWLSGSTGSTLHQRLAGATLDNDSFCSVAALSLRPRNRTPGNELALGDALTMIPPVTGNGMSMAFESAELAIAPLTQYSRRECPWTDASADVTQLCHKQFTRRLRWAARLHPLLFQPTIRMALLRVAGGSLPIWRLLFNLTR